MFLPYTRCADIEHEKLIARTIAKKPSLKKKKKRK